MRNTARTFGSRRYETANAGNVALYSLQRRGHPIESFEDLAPRRNNELDAKRGQAALDVREIGIMEGARHLQGIADQHERAHALANRNDEG